MGYHEIQPGEIEAPSQRRVPFWSKIGGGALTFAVLFHVILLILAAIWIFQVIPKAEAKVDFLTGGGGGGGGERAAQTKVQQKKRARITPSTNIKRVFAEGAKSNYSIPDPGDNFGNMSPLPSLSAGGMSGGLGGAGSGRGFGNGNGNGLGMGNGAGKLFGLIPEALSKRCSKDDRLQRLRENGGTPACEEAVLNGLRWLKENQNPDGSWNGPNKVAMTGLALLAYFGHCETPVSPEFGESCLRGITYLVSVGMVTDGILVDGVAVKVPKMAKVKQVQDSGGRKAREAQEAAERKAHDAKEAEERKTREALARSRSKPVTEPRAITKAPAPPKQTYAGSVDSYAHAIGTYALGEATTFCKDIKLKVPNLLEVTEQAGQFIIDNQHTSGGWDYGYDMDGPRGGDVSIVGWQLQALKACSHTTVKYKGLELCIEKALAYLSTCQSTYGGYSYTSGTGGGRSDSMTGIGMLCLQMWDQGKSEAVSNAAHFLDGKMKFDYKSVSLYAHYYLSQAMMQRGGEDWNKYNALFRDELLNNQNKDGSWDPDRSWVHEKVFSTCLCTLMLEVYYRFLSTGGDERKKLPANPARPGLSGI